VKAGSGSPLIIVPATVSLIRQWLPLTQFMGELFTGYFFELPGRGGSTPYPEKFKSQFINGILYVMNAPRLEKLLTYALSKASNVDRRILENKHTLQMSISTLELFAHTLGTIT